MSVQKHEGEILEEGARLDHGEEGEEEETGTVRQHGCISNSDRTHTFIHLLSCAETLILLTMHHT